MDLFILDVFACNFFLDWDTLFIKVLLNACVVELTLLDVALLSSVPFVYPPDDVGNWSGLATNKVSPNFRH